MRRAGICRVLCFIVLALLAPAAWASDALSFFNNWFVTGDYVVGGVGLRATGVNGFATGTIKMSGVPAGAEPIAAFLYWSSSEPTTTPSARIGYFDGHEIQGTVLGNPQTPNLPCYSSGGALGLPGTAGQVYRADVLRYLPVNTENIRQVNGNHTVKLADSGGNGNGSLLYTDGASLVVIYRTVIPGTPPGSPTAAPLRAVVIYNGAFSMDKHSSGMTQNVAGFYDASATNPAAKITNIVANGQPGFSTPLSVNGTTVSSSPFVGAQGTRWDNPTYSFKLAKDASSFSTLTTVGGNQVCVTWAAVVASVNVQDSDNDGLLDAWETKGLHRNTQVSPATFGGCSDYKTEPCVDLPNMGASVGTKDIFIQMDWMHGGTHDHIPKLNALSVVAGTFAPHGINLHFDVGGNYQNACGTVTKPVQCSFIVPAAQGRGGLLNAQGGSDIDEATLVCANTPKHPCDYQVTYPVLSFEFGFASVKDGNHLLNLSPHFAQNRKDIFHYALFAHALAGPFDINGHPIVDPSTGQPTPKSYSGIAHRPGGGFMVTFGLWRSDFAGDDQVGSAQAQAGTIMHELGHNLDLSHAGLATQPNCMPNYQSVMNYLYQTRGLTTASGESVDYSLGNVPTLNEKSLSTASLGPNQLYAIRFFGPVGPGTPPGSAAQLHCDGTAITPGVSEVRLEGPVGATPDWSNGTVKPPTAIPPTDINFDGSVTGVFADQPDWRSLNLQQIGSGYSFGGLSLGAYATDGGVYATDGGALATDAGALATDGGVFATDGGAFATDGGAFATDGGVFATDGGALATDGGALATDAGDLDQTTLILSGSAGPPTGVTATNTINSIQLTWMPPDGASQSYNVYRCAGPGCTPSAPAYKSVTGGTATPSFPDSVNDFIHAGATCPSGYTCYNTTYTYTVTSVAMGIESGFSQLPVTSEVTHLFVIGDVSSSVVYNGTDQSSAVSSNFHIYGHGTPSPTVTCTTSATPARNAATYNITCSAPEGSQVSPTVGVTYDAPYNDGTAHTQGTLTITQRPITVTAVAIPKIYDGTANSPTPPAVTSAYSPAVLATDTGHFQQTFNDANAGTSKTLTPSGSVDDGNGGKNYNVTFAIISTGVINKANATIIVAPYSVIYTGALYSAAGTATGVKGEALGGLSLTATAHSAAGTYLDTWVFTDATGNYNSTSNMVTDSIAQAPLTVMATGINKVYDGTTAATVTLSDNRVAGDVFTDSYASATFSEANVGTGKAVTVSGILIAGLAAGNYYLTSTTANTTADITLGFGGPYTLDHWMATASVSNDGSTTTITPPSGASPTGAFGYNIIIPGNPGVTARTWTFQTTAAAAGTVSFHWHYVGFHAFNEVTALLQAFSGASVTPLYSAGPTSCCTTPSNGFDVSGDATITVNQGDMFGFTVGGSNFDSNSQLNGTLTITNFSAPF